MAYESSGHLMVICGYSYKPQIHVLLSAGDYHSHVGIAARGKRPENPVDCDGETHVANASRRWAHMLLPRDVLPWKCRGLYTVRR